MMHPATRTLSVVDLSTIRCDGCGVYDPSLRYSSHPAILSFLAGASESAHVGLWCARCRAMHSAKAIAISLIGGWWSLRGPKLTINAIRANLKGGTQQTTTSAQLLRGIARFEFDSGNPELAAMFARVAQDVQPQLENRRFLEDLARAGHRLPFPESPWRFVPFAPVAVFVLALLGLGAQVMPRADVKVPVASASVVSAPAPRTTSAKPKPMAYSSWDSNASADTLEKELKSNSDPALARAYFKARLLEAQSEIPMRVRRGDSLWPIETSIIALGNNPAVAPALAKSSQRAAYENVVTAMRESLRYYHGGAPVEVLERQAGETLNVTVDAVISAIDADMRGRDTQRDAAASEANRGASAIEEMRRDIRIRAAVISVTTKAIEECLKVTG